MTNHTHIRVRPKPGLIVPKPDGTHLAAEGETVAVSGWWRRREAEGAVEIDWPESLAGTPPEAPSKPASKAVSKTEKGA